MILLNAYKSKSLSNDCFDRYGEAGAVKIVIGTAPAISHQNINKSPLKYNEYPDWDVLPFCLRSDWKLLKSWEIAEGDQLLPDIAKELGRRFSRPRILGEIADALVSYADHLFEVKLNRDIIKNGIKDIYCFGKDESDTLFSAYFSKEEGYRSEGYQRLFDAILIGRIDGIVEDVLWEHNKI